MNWFSRLTVNQRLAFVALLLGAVALFSRPIAGATVRINPQELAVMVDRGADRVAPLNLAGWIIEGRSDYRLVDLRDQGEYSRYHIPTAENIPLTSLATADFAPSDKVLLYSDDGARSTQGWFLLTARGFRGAYVLTDGLDGWKRTVLFPVLAAGADRTANAKLEAMSRYFGGTARVTATGDGASTTLAPDATTTAEAASLPPPPPPAASSSTPPKPKRKEGC